MIVRCHRREFRAHWRLRSRSIPGRPQVFREVRNRIREISLADLSRGATWIHGEISKLGVDVAQSTVARYTAKDRRLLSASWRASPANHAAGVASVDFFVAPTITFKLLFGFVVLHHDRRQLVAVTVTAHPTAGWLARQISEAFPWESAPRYLIGDRGRLYGEPFSRCVRSMGIRDRPIAPRCPRQNAFAEPIVGSIRRESLDHL